MELKIKLADEFARKLTFQDYSPQGQIDGVFAEPLKKHRALEGSFMEYLRLTEGRVEGLPVDFEARQVSLTWAAPGRINAFHVHPKVVQDEMWCVIGGEMRIWLIDLREGSPTLGTRRQYVLSGECPTLLHIPAGVAHGYKAGPDGATMLYVMNSQFNLDDPNEGRLDWDHFGPELWEADRG